MVQQAPTPNPPAAYANEYHDTSPVGCVLTAVCAVAFSIVHTRAALSVYTRARTRMVPTMSLPASLAHYVVFFNQSTSALTWEDAKCLWLNMWLAAECAVEHLATPQQRQCQMSEWFKYILTQLRRGDATLKIRTLIAQYVVGR